MPVAIVRRCYQSPHHRPRDDISRQQHAAQTRRKCEFNKRNSYEDTFKRCVTGHNSGPCAQCGHSQRDGYGYAPHQPPIQIAAQVAIALIPGFDMLLTQSGAKYEPIQYAPLNAIPAV